MYYSRLDKIYFSYSIPAELQTHPSMFIKFSIVDDPCDGVKEMACHVD